ncbi:MAG: ATP-binding protein [Pseudomonadota bacterium]
MKRLGIKYQILLIALVPVLVIDILFTYLQIDGNIEQANRLLKSKGQIIAQQLAGASEFNVYSGNDAQIKYLLDQSVDKNDIVFAAIYDDEGQLISQSLSTDYDPLKAPEYLYFRQPIQSQSIELSDIFTPEIVRGQQSDILGWVHLYISRQQLQQTIRQILVESSIFFISILVIAILVTIIISRRVTRPIIRLMEHLKLVETGQLGKTIEPIEPNEIGAVQKGFNRMTRALLANRQNLNERIQQATQQLNAAITDLETKNRELGMARDEAQSANETKSKFLANMSHEIRTPINGIKGFINLLGQSTLDSTQQRYVDIVLKSTNDLTGIVNEILDFSKMESGKLQIVEEAFDLFEIIEQTRDILFINVLTKNIDLNLIIYSDTPRWVCGDKLRLKQILLNLIGNAIKFTDQGQVVIRVSLEDQIENQIEVAIAIEDSGIGISEEDQQHLFQAFSQVDSSDNRRFTGTGLGLVISKNLSKLMGGDIVMHSKPGIGSKFELKLPFRIAEDESETLIELDPQPTALIIGANPTCLTETRCLYDRAGLHTEIELVASAFQDDEIIELIQRNLAYTDFLVFDLRHFDVNLNRIINPELARSCRIIAMHYEHSFDRSILRKPVEFISVINSNAELRKALFHAGKPTTSAMQETSGNTANKKVLLVDDNPINLKLASELVSLWGHLVVEAEHGEQAMEFYREDYFDLIILDIQMPDIDGASLLQMMRDLKPEDKAPIVALTANVLQDEADRLLELGFDYFMSKPIDENKFRKLVNGDLQRRLLSSNEEDAGESPDCSVDYQRSLALSADNAALLKQIFEILKRDIPDHRRQLAKAAETKAMDRLAAIAHKLNGVTCYASLPKLRRKVLGFQQRLARDNNLDLKSAIQEIDNELAAVLGEVEDYLQQMTVD